MLEVIINILGTNLKGSYHLPTPKSNVFSDLTKNVYFRVVKLLFFTQKRRILKKSFNRPLDGSMNLFCTKFQLSNPYRFRKIALDGRTAGLTQNGDCIVALQQLKNE